MNRLDLAALVRPGRVANSSFRPKLLAEPQVPQLAGHWALVSLGQASLAAAKNHRVTRCRKSRLSLLARSEGGM
jgi:hypothetical protein